MRNGRRRPVVMYNHRCSKHGTCGKRVTLRRDIDNYIRRPKCPRCKCDTLRNVTKDVRKQGQQRKCFCDGMSYPHAKGTGFCNYNDKLTAADLEERHVGH